VPYCVACGAERAAPVDGGGEGVVCAACGAAWYPALKIAAGVLVERDGDLLLLRRGPADEAFAGAWNLPAGFGRPGEEPRQTAAREAAEEAGLEVQPGRLAGAYYFDDDPRGEGVLLVYEVEASEDQVQVDGLEATAAGFFSPGALPVPLCGGGHEQAIRAWAARRLDRWQPWLPPRYCPHCTAPLHERPAFGRRRLTCHACGFVHFREAKVGVSVLVEEAGRLLLVRRAIDPGQGLWSLPSGFLDWDEAPEVAAVRECAEETGLQVADPVLVEVRQYTDDFRGPGLNLVYRARAAGGRLEAGDDAAEVRFFAPEELPAGEDVAFANHRRLIDGWRQGERGAEDGSKEQGAARQPLDP
jgi:8-oxo-dGTP diphosphatase